MFRKYISFMLVVLAINLACGVVAFAETKAEKEARFIEKVKENVTKLGTGKDARVEVKLKDGTKLKGYVREINENGFIVVNDKTGKVSEVSYPNAKQVKGNNLSNGVKIALGVVGLVAFVVILIVAGRS